MSHLKLRSLLTIGFGLLLGMLAIVGGLSIYFANGLSENITRVATYRLPNVANFGALETQVYTLRSLALSVFIYKEATPSTANALNEVISSRQTAWTEGDAIMEKVSALPPRRADMKELYAKLYATLGEYRKVNAPLDAVLPKMAAAAASRDEAQFRTMHEEYEKAYESVGPVSAQLRGLMNESLHKHEALGAEDGTLAVESANTFTVLVTTLALAGIIGGIIIGFSIQRAVFSQIGGEPTYIQSVMETIRSGDLRAKIDLRPGDTSSALYSIATTTDGLRDMMSLINRNSTEIATRSGELSATSEMVATSSENQSQAATTMAAAVEQMTVSINHVSSSANDANKMAQQSGDAARNGADTIRSVVVDINRVARDIGDAAKSIEELGEQSREIASVVNIIKEVADQTNLLALNAAIEAARAGEQGRGFAVVADEVRKLAERTSSSTEDIARIVGQISAGTEHAVQTMRQQSENVKTTVELSERAGSTVGQINDASSSVLGAVSEISLALSEQSTASSEIAKNVECIASMSEDNTLAVRGAAEAALGLSKLAAELQGVISNFKI